MKKTAKPDAQESKDDVDPVNMNGILIYKKKKPPIPEGLSSDFTVHSPFGFKIMKIGGKDVWAVGTETDYRRSEAKRQKIKPEQVKIPKDIHLMEGCHSNGIAGCSGTCMSTITPLHCRQVNDPAHHYYYCICDA
jgi:hypothetical protein